MLKKLKGLVMEEQGQGTTEYALVLGGIAIFASAAIVIFKDELTEMWTALGDTVHSSHTKLGIVEAPE